MVLCNLTFFRQDFLAGQTCLCNKYLVAKMVTTDAWQKLYFHYVQKLTFKNNLKIESVASVKP
jgi:hypothetical protein